MTRTARTKSETGIYHVMARGVNRQPVFEEDADSRKFLEVLAACKELGGFELYAYCLMGNHFHLLIRPSGEEPLETVFRRIGGRYVVWFNRKYGRAGHLFQDRFASEAVADDAYFLSCLRYILQNPVAAGLCESPFDYPFSSAREYIGVAEGITDTAMALEMVGEDGFAEFACSAQAEGHLDMPGVSRMTDAEVRSVMLHVSGCADASAFQRLAKADRDVALAAMRRAGGSIRQVGRVTGASPGVVRKFPGRKRRPY